MTARLSALALLLLGGCATTSPKESFEDVSRLVESRTGSHLRWNAGTPEDDAVEREVRDLLSRELTVDGAVQVALLNNHQLQATYEELGVAQADLVQAGLLKNPSFGGRVRFPTGGGGLNTEFSVAGDFLDLFILPLRKRVAEAELHSARLRVGSAVLETAAAVREAYYRLQAAQQVLALRQTVAESEGAAAELHRRQHEAGNIPDLEFVSEEAQYQQARLDLARSEQDLLEAQEQLHRLLGVWGSETGWKLAGSLPELPRAEVPLERLESLAVSQRLDLDVARRQTEALRHALALTSGARLLGGLEFGASTERDPEGTRVTGPELRVELPIFDQHQAAVARLESQLRAQQARQSELAIAVRSEVRLARSRLLAARAVAEHYRTVLVPLREKVVVLSQQNYNAMLLGVYGLLQAKQNEINTYREYVEAVRDYWIARADLERAVGGRLTTPTPPVQP